MTQQFKLLIFSLFIAPFWVACDTSPQQAEEEDVSQTETVEFDYEVIDEYVKKVEADQELMILQDEAMLQDASTSIEGFYDEEALIKVHTFSTTPQMDQWSTIYLREDEPYYSSHIMVDSECNEDSLCVSQYAYYYDDDRIVMSQMRSKVIPEESDAYLFDDDIQFTPIEIDVDSVKRMVDDRLQTVQERLAAQRDSLMNDA